MLLNTNGITVYASDKEHKKEELGKPLPDVDSSVLEEGKKGIHFSNIFKNKRESNRFGLFITAPLYDFDNTLIGVAALEVDMTPLYTMIEDTTGLGQTEGRL